MMLMMRYAVADHYGTDYKIPVEKVNFKILQYHEIKRKEEPKKTS